MAAVTFVEERDGTGVTVHIVGEIDLYTAEEVYRHAGGVLRGEEPARLTLDLTGVAFCDGCGLVTLLRLRQLAEDAGTAMTVAGAQPIVARVLAVTDLLPVD